MYMYIISSIAKLWQIIVNKSDGNTQFTDVIDYPSTSNYIDTRNWDTWNETRRNIN